VALRFCQDGWSGIHLATVGHSTRSLDELAALLLEAELALLVDIRSVPRSRRNPQFEQRTLPGSLSAFGIDYLHVAELGGLRRALPLELSANQGWRNERFRGYADYMQTAGFADGLARLLEAARDQPAAIMCAEAVPWRCHRTLVADAVVACGGEVRHLIGLGQSHPHRLTPFARVEGERLVYPKPEREAVSPVP